MTSRLFSDPAEIAKRKKKLAESRSKPLRDYVADLREKNPFNSFLDFDPEDGGASASVLFLFEKPGPKAFRSGFISRDNDDPTAAATGEFLKQAGIPRRETALWNIIPGWNGTIKVTASELRDGLDHLDTLLPLFSNLRTIVLVGASAGRARPRVTATGLQILSSAHPSQRVRNLWPDRWRAIPQIWATARWQP